MDDDLREAVARKCRGCANELEEGFRFCPWCGASQRLKIVEWFRGNPRLHADQRRRDLRVSRYLGEHAHVRLSIWEEGRAEAATALADAEAERLARFLLSTAPAERARKRSFPQRFRSLVGR